MNTISLLLVEDNKADARLLRELLREADEHFEVTHVERLADALDILREDAPPAVLPDIVFLDLSLPDGQGLDNVRQLHAARPEVPIVILTGQDDDTLALSAAQAGAQEYLVKGQGDGKLVSREARYAIERAETLQKLREGEERFRLLAENISDLVCLHDLEGTYRYVSPSVRRVLGYEPDQLLGTRPDCIMHPHDLGKAAAYYQRTLEGGDTESLTYRIRCADGHYIWLETFAKPVYEKGKFTALQTSSRDVTERVEYETRIHEQMDELGRARAELEAKQHELLEANARLHDLATTDGLTGLKNHRAFQDGLREEWSRARRLEHPLSLLLLDVDFFKKYNDSFGHPAGDEILRIVARLLQETTRDTDMAARYGGEEFVALLPNTDQQGALQWAERFREAMSRVQWPNRPITISIGAATAEVGLCESDSTPRDPPQLIAEADRALYKSKSDGRNRVTHARQSADAVPEGASEMVEVAS